MSSLGSGVSSGSARGSAGGASPWANRLGWPALVVRVVLAGVFLFAGMIKIQNPALFAFSVEAFKILPEHLVKLVTFVVPWTELIVGVLLLVGLWGRAAALVLAGMIAVFLAGIVSVIARDMQVSCSCFGDYEFPCKSPIGMCHVARNAVLLAGAMFLVWSGPGALAIDRASRA